MKSAILIVAVLAACTTAAPQYPNSISESHYSPPSSYSGSVSPPQSSARQEIQEPENKIVFKHVFVHVAKDDEPANQQIRKVKGPGGNEKHVKIIFVKAPAAAAPDQQVVELAQANERKSLVYVLLKKAADAPDVKFANPAPTSASKPEVYFIRYRDQKPTGEVAAAGNPGAAYGVPSPGGATTPGESARSGY